MEGRIRIFVNATLAGSTSSAMFFNDLIPFFGNRMQSSSSKANIILCGATSFYKNTTRARSIVQRLDGIYYDLDDPKKLQFNNANIRNIYLRANGVIFQSDFAQRLVHKTFGLTNAKTTVIHNGSHMTDKHHRRYREKFKHIQQMRNEGYQIFLAAASWRDVKRLEGVINGFVEYNRTHKMSKLLLAGSGAEASYPEGVIPLGKLPKKYLMALYHGIDLLINLSFTDACPNVVVEALAAKKPVLVTNNQGSQEFYGGNGYVINEPWDLSPIHYSRMPQIDPVEVAHGIKKALAAGYKNEVDVSMESCALKYLKFFRELRGYSS